MTEEGRKKPRKTKKQSEKEILKYLLDCETKAEDNMRYLSFNERKSFEQKFYQPKNPSQTKLLKYLNDQTKKIVIATGPAGTGKTLFMTQAAIRFFLLGTYDKLIFTRPSVAVDEELGFLPGTLEEKMAPWMRPIYDILYAHITPSEVAKMVEEKIIEISPLGFMRGRTFKNCCIVADEAQNCTPSQMMMMLTRLGENSRIFVTGDLEQCDLKSVHGSGLKDFLNKLNNRKHRSDSISSIEFSTEDVEREEVVKTVLDIYAGTLDDLNGQNT
jgi:phosphate starvation-inducible protein PhoH and related proteins